MYLSICIYNPSNVESEHAFFSQACSVSTKQLIGQQHTTTIYFYVDSQKHGIQWRKQARIVSFDRHHV